MNRQAEWNGVPSTRAGARVGGGAGARVGGGTGARVDGGAGARVHSTWGRTGATTRDGGRRDERMERGGAAPSRGRGSVPGADGPETEGCSWGHRSKVGANVGESGESGAT
jgi:hypothetical protein